MIFHIMAEIAGEYLHKGSRVYIAGRLKTSSWLDDSGERQYRTEVVLGELIMLDTPPHRDTEEDEDGDAGGAHPPPTQRNPARRAPHRRTTMTKAELAARAADVL